MTTKTPGQVFYETFWGTGWDRVPVGGQGNYERAVQAAIAHLSTHPPASGGVEWQPIETAPKTSKARLVWCPERENIYCVTWDKDTEGWAHFSDDGSACWEMPTHWMPLPAAPEAPKP